MATRIIPIALATFSGLWVGAADAGLFKCIQPDGSIAYQQLPCPPATDGGQIQVDTTPPGGKGATRGGEEYSIESQLRAMQGERDRDQTARDKAREASRKTGKESDNYDRARCAKHRAQVARWREDIRNGYRTPNEKEYEAQMLEHHEALAERYCAGH